MNWKDDVHFEPEKHEIMGGQHVGVTTTGVWAIHATGMKAFSNGARSQHKNRLIALDMLEYGLRETGIL